MVKILFETFNVKNAYIAHPGPMALYAVGRTAGLVCDIGDGLTQCTHIYEGFLIDNAVEES